MPDMTKVKAKNSALTTHTNISMQLQFNTSKQRKQ